MVGVVGYMKICYGMSGDQYEEMIDPQITAEFCLKYCNQVKFRIEEVTYIEDTVYGVVLSLLEPQFREDEYIVSSGNTDFLIEEYDIAGNISLCFYGGNI